jgi:hypothetical protein
LIAVAPISVRLVSILVATSSICSSLLVIAVLATTHLLFHSSYCARGMVATPRHNVLRPHLANSSKCWSVTS